MKINEFIVVEGRDDTFNSSFNTLSIISSFYNYKLIDFHLKRLPTILNFKALTDTERVKRAVECDTIETNGSAINEQTLEVIRNAHNCTSNFISWEIWIC
jgi:hypothetical protein